MAANPIDVLDAFYAQTLGCSARDLNSGHLMTISSPSVGGIQWSKGSPLALLALGRGESTVICAQPDIKPALDAALHHTTARVLDDRLCSLLQEVVDPLILSGTWFRGFRFYCDPEAFADQSIGTVRNVTREDRHARELHEKWGGDVYGQEVDGRIVAWAAVKPFSRSVWDLSVETLPDYRGHGYAKSVASAALKRTFLAGKIAGWGTDCDNTPSIRAARSLGFRDYALDFGCIERRPTAQDV